MASVFNTILLNIKNAVTELSNTSLTAIFYKIAQVIAIAVDNTIQEINNTVTIITNIISTQRYGKALYYINKALAYQEGVTLSVNSVTLEPYYSSIDETKLLIKKAAFQIENSNNLQLITLKVVTTDDTNAFIKLTPSQLTAFTSYILIFELPGVPLRVLSIDPNIVNFNAQITYYSTYDLSTLQSNIESNLISFRDKFNFNNTFFVNDLETYLTQKIAGIRNVSLTLTSIDGVNFTGSTALIAGYFDYMTNIINNFTYVAI
jgi:hypothetical protein